MQEVILDTLFLGPRKFEILLTQCDDLNCTCKSYYHTLFMIEKLKEEYSRLKFVPILYCFVMEKAKKYKTSTRIESNSDLMLNGKESNHIVIKNTPSKTKQRFLEKSWITIEFGPDVFKYKHEYKRTFAIKDFIAIVQNGDLLCHLGLDSFDDNCVGSLNQQICNYFSVKK
jgi:hypothetical protein